MMNRDIKNPELRSAQNDDGIFMEMYQKYATEVYGVMVSFTGGEAKGILKKMDDTRGGFDG
eukprot:12410840-Karenia_brevis.AAC.1